MKKKIFLLFLTGSLLLTGCNGVIELSDEETTKIAEYAAELLLKYDVNYVDRISDGGEELAKQLEEESMQETDTDDVSKDSDFSGNIDEKNELPYENSQTGTERNIARIAGIEGVDITYKDYTVTSHYPEADTDEEFVYIEAPDGYQLLVVRFNVLNNSEKKVSFSLLDKGISYRIVCNGNHLADPMLTILMDDLGTLETTLESGKEQEAVLVFQISDSIKDNLESIELKVNYNNVDNIISILK